MVDFFKPLPIINNKKMKMILIIIFIFFFIVLINLNFVKAGTSCFEQVNASNNVTDYYMLCDFETNDLSQCNFNQSSIVSAKICNATNSCPYYHGSASLNLTGGGEGYWIFNITPTSYPYTIEFTQYYVTFSDQDRYRIGNGTWTDSGKLQDGTFWWMPLWTNTSLFGTISIPYNFSIIYWNNSGNISTNLSIFGAGGTSNNNPYKSSINNYNNWSLANRLSMGFESNVFTKIIDDIRVYNGTECPIRNSAPDLNVTISPKPTLTTDNISCIISYFDVDNDDWQKNETRWYNGSNLLSNLDNLTKIQYTNTSDNETWICQARVYDGLNWSIWKNDSTIIADSTAPNITYYNLTTSWYSDEYVTFNVNCSDISSSIDFVKFKIVSEESNRTMTAITLNKEYKFNSSTFGVGTYNISHIYCKDTSGNLNTTLSNLLFTSSTRPSPAPSEGGGGGPTIAPPSCPIGQVYETFIGQCIDIQSNVTLSVTPKRVDTYWTYRPCLGGSNTFKYSLRANKLLKSADIIENRTNFNINLKNSTVDLSAKLTFTNFFIKDISNTIRIQDYSNVVVYVPIVTRIINFCQSIPLPKIRVGKTDKIMSSIFEVKNGVLSGIYLWSSIIILGTTSIIGYKKREFIKEKLIYLKEKFRSITPP